MMLHKEKNPTLNLTIKLENICNNINDYYGDTRNNSLVNAIIFKLLKKTEKKNITMKQILSEDSDIWKQKNGKFAKKIIPMLSYLLYYDNKLDMKNPEIDIYEFLKLI